ncbi:alpha/beta-hydrolase [Mycena floridula]|nr:alpha/beta-hydrolase [Mycena floridula]
MDDQDDLPTIFDPISLFKKGFHRVSDHALYYEVHGTGPQKIVLINGLNTSCFGWNFQVKEFGRNPLYQVLVFDNRGVGYSEYPSGRYTTSGMAEDAIALVDFLGWTEKRQLHIVGVSLGGMISQEVASRIPERIVSLTLTVTTPGGFPWNNLPPWAGTAALLRLLMTLDPSRKIPIAMTMLYPPSWLPQKSDSDPEGRTNREVQTEIYVRRVTLTRKQRLVGHVSQLLAGLTHRVTAERLGTISNSVPKVLILTGDQDKLMDPKHSLELKEAMPEAEYIKWE